MLNGVIDDEKEGECGHAVTLMAGRLTTYNNQTPYFQRGNNFTSSNIQIIPHIQKIQS